ncbi:MAG: S-adenosylmethionine:tRNA ribosyltransferase-isomerase, partial [Proteobacteria bacterium]|nr:S-adenosylmethionine:tRNA ribosyltransferase-isomerase [Pseudomonadota bacterium]
MMPPSIPFFYQTTSNDHQYRFEDCGIRHYQEHPKLQDTPLKLSDFDYHLPEDKIAHQPLETRDQSRLCYMDTKGNIRDHHFFELPEILQRKTLMIVNDSGVFKARIVGQRKTGKPYEILLLERPSSPQKGVPCLCRPQKQLLAEEVLLLPGGITAKLRCNDQGKPRIYFDAQREELMTWLDQYGLTPLPPYIRRKTMLRDAARYQNLYSSSDYGSVAASTAGFHFSHDLMAKLQAKGHEFVFIRLHIGGGTFLPVRSDDLNQHEMHSEKYLIPQKSLAKILEFQAKGDQILYVGTTALRAMESFAKSFHYCGEQMMRATDQWHETSLFIYPKTKRDLYHPWLGHGMVTNFHT